MGRVYSKERNLKISKTRLENKKKNGYINSPETRLKISLAKKGKSPWNKGKKMPNSMGKKLSKLKNELFSNPENHPRWLDGRSFEPYPKEFTKSLKREIRRLDGEICQLCGIKQKDSARILDVHHIDYNKYNCSKSNLITLCRGCNSKVNVERGFWMRFFHEKVQRLKTEYPEMDNDIV